MRSGVASYEKKKRAAPIAMTRPAWNAGEVGQPASHLNKDEAKGASRVLSQLSVGKNLMAIGFVFLLGDLNLRSSLKNRDWCIPASGTACLGAI